MKILNSQKEKTISHLQNIDMMHQTEQGMSRNWCRNTPSVGLNDSFTNIGAEVVYDGDRQNNDD